MLGHVLVHEVGDSKGLDEPGEEDGFFSVMMAFYECGPLGTEADEGVSSFEKGGGCTGGGGCGFVQLGWLVWWIED